MRKLHGILLCSLSKNRIWGYQEILAEALVVVWITTQISVKFGTSFFPQWQTGRTASDYPTSLDTVLELFGYKVRGCALNGMLAPWRNVPPYSDVPDTDIVTSPLRANLGYAGAVVTVCATIMLSLSVAGSLIVNRHWRLPKSTHAHMRGCDRITVLLDYHLHCMNADLDKSYEEIPVKSCLAVFGLEVLSVVTMVCALLLWIIGCVLPIISLLAVISMVVVAELGAEAEYPCWVGFVCLLSLHCTGRLWGLWISEGYFSWMRKKFRRPLGVDDPADASRSEEFAEPDAAIPTAADEQERDAHYDSPPALGWTMVIGSLTVLYFVGDLALKLPGLISLFRGNIYLSTTNCTECCINNEAILDPGSAMYSYWLEPQMLNDSYAETLLKFTPSTSEKFGGGVFAIWSTFVAALFLLPSITVAVIAVGAGFCCLVRWFCHDNTDETDARVVETLDSAWHKAGKAVAKGYADMHTLTSACVCHRMTRSVDGIIIVLRRAACWLFLPLPVLRLFLAEQLQVPGLLIIMTGYLGWVFWSHHQNEQRIESDDFERARQRRVSQKQLPADHPLVVPNKPLEATNFQHVSHYQSRIPGTTVDSQQTEV